MHLAYPVASPLGKAVLEKARAAAEVACGGGGGGARRRGFGTAEMARRRGLGAPEMQLAVEKKEKR